MAAPRAKPAKNGQAGQLNGFIQAARALGADESEEHFNAALAKVARHKPPSEPEKEPKPKKPKPAQ